MPSIIIFSMLSHLWPRYRAIRAATQTPTNMGTWTAAPKITMPIASTPISAARVMQDSHTFGILGSLLDLFASLMDFYQPFFHYFAIIAFLIQRWIPGFYLDLCEVHSSSLSFYTLHTVSAVPGARGVGARPGTRERTENVSQFRGAAVRRPARSWPRPGPSPPHRSPPQWRLAGG